MLENDCDQIDIRSDSSMEGSSSWLMVSGDTVCPGAESVATEVAPVRVMRE